MSESMHTTEFELPSSSGQPIRGNVHLPELITNAPVLVFCHGFKGFKDWGIFPTLMDEFAAAGWVAIRFNFSLNGIGDDPMNFTELENFRRNTYSQELDDLETVISAIVEREIVPDECNPRCLALAGHSRGGGIAIVKAAENPHVRSVVALAAMGKFDNWGEKTKADWRERGSLEILNTRTNQRMPLGVGLLEDAERNAARLNVQSAAAKLEVPVLFIHGEQDVTIPVEQMKATFAAANPSFAEYEIIPNTGHTFGAAHPYQGMPDEFRRIIQRMQFWLKANTLPG